MIIYAYFVVNYFFFSKNNKASGKLFMCGDGKYGKLCMDVNQITIPTLVSSFVDRHLNVQMVSINNVFLVIIFWWQHFYLNQDKNDSRFPRNYENKF